MFVLSLVPKPAPSGARKYPFSKGGMSADWISLDGSPMPKLSASAQLGVARIRFKA